MNNFRKSIFSLLISIVSLILGNLIINSGLVSSSYKAIIFQIGIYLISSFSLNFTLGYLGEFTLGHAGFLAAGAYTSALLVKNGINFIVAIIISATISLLLGYIIGFLSSRLRGDYLAISSLGLSEIIRICIVNIDIFGGPKGLKSIPKYSSFLVIFSFVILTFLTFNLILNSKHGRAIISIRENEIASKSLGINTNKYKILAFCVSGFFAGISGALWAGNQGILTPGEFGFMKSVEILVMVILGGIGSMSGSVISTSLLVSFPLIFQMFIPGMNKYRMVIYSLILILIMIFRPSGIMGKKEFSLFKMRRDKNE